MHTVQEGFKMLYYWRSFLNRRRVDSVALDALNVY